MHLQPKLDADQSLIDKISPLPLDKTIVQVFVAFLKYLLEYTSYYNHESEGNGVNLWASVKKDTDFLLPHPSRWDEMNKRNYGPQQCWMDSFRLSFVY